VTDWGTLGARARERYADGERRLPGVEDADARQRQLTRMGNAAYAAGLAEVMRAGSGAEWFDRAAQRYRQSFADAPPGSWGRPIGALKARVLADDWDGAAGEARWALEAGAAEADSPIGRYAAALALLVLGRDDEARVHADEIRTHEGFPTDVGDAVAMIAAGTDRVGYVEAIESVLESFESRDEYLEDMPVADTVIVLQALAARRDLAAELESALLP
jgi:hypothetical protein